MRLVEKTAKAKAMRECDPIVKRAFLLLLCVYGVWLITGECLATPPGFSALSLAPIRDMWKHTRVTRIRGLRARSDALGRVGVQGQVQGRTGLYAIIVSRFTPLRL